MRSLPTSGSSPLDSIFGIIEQNKGVFTISYDNSLERVGLNRKDGVVKITPRHLNRPMILTVR